MSTSTVTTKDRIKLPFTYDAERLKKEINSDTFQDFIYYDVKLLRGPAHMVDTSLPPPPPAEDYADGSWTDWLDTEELKKSPYLMEIVDQFRQHTTVNLVRLLRLAPGSVVREHNDPTLALEEEKSMIRLTIPIATDEKVEFYLNDKIVPMKEGECWYMRLSDRHRINNGWDQERINLTIDMIPNDWVRNTILDSQ